VKIRIVALPARAKMSDNYGHLDEAVALAAIAAGDVGAVVHQIVVKRGSVKQGLGAYSQYFIFFVT
jgi:hypothetical protein